MNRKKHGSVIAGLLLLGLVFLWGCSSSTEPQSGPDPVAVTGVTLGIEGGNLNIVVNAAKRLVWVVSPADATVKGVTFSSGTESVATVSSGGLVTAVSAGNAVITVTTDDGAKTATVNVTVVAAEKSLTGISITDGPTLTLTGPESKTLGVTLTPTDATDDIVWSSSDGATVAVNSGGTATAKKAGTATITAAKKESDGTSSTMVKASITITVAEPQKGIKITGLSAMNGKNVNLSIFDKNSLEEILVDTDDYIARTQGTISGGVVDMVLADSGNNPWTGTGNYLVSFSIDNKSYISNGKVSFLFAKARPELSLGNFSEVSSGGGGNESPVEHRGTWKKGDITLTIMATQIKVSGAGWANGTFQIGGVSPKSEYYHYWYYNDNTGIDDPFGIDCKLNDGKLFINDKSGPSELHGTWTKQAGSGPTGKSITITGIPGTGNGKGYQLGLSLDKTTLFQGYSVAGVMGTVSGNAITGELQSYGSFNAGTSYYVGIVIGTQTSYSRYVSKTTVSFSGATTSLSFNDFDAASTEP
ncbi:MAG: Ig-like domain-containing protein [Treponema sp.]|jgi:uncharacterized protein YjdB|nr:Ig-like domain-containing protein [Treponema sp.]